MSDANALTDRPNENDGTIPPAPQEPPEVTITTLPFALTPDVYFRILLRITYWNTWWQMAFAVIVAGLSCLAMILIDDEGIRMPCFLAVAICIFLLLFWLVYPYVKCRSLAHHPANKPIMKTRVNILSKDRIIINEPESESVANFTREDIFAIEKCKGYYMIWVTQQQMLYLPKNAFTSPADVETFESKILPAYKEHKRSLQQGFFVIVAILAGCIVIGCILGVIIALLNYTSP